MKTIRYTHSYAWRADANTVLALCGPLKKDILGWLFTSREVVICHNTPAPFHPLVKTYVLQRTTIPDLTIGELLGTVDGDYVYLLKDQ